MQKSGINISSVEEIEQYIELIQNLTDRNQIKKWLRCNLRKYLINKYPEIRKVRRPKKESAIWLKKAIYANRTVDTVLISDSLIIKLNHVIDYLNILESRKLRQLSKVDVSIAIRKSQIWLKQLNSKASNSEDLKGIEEIINYANGHRWVQIISRYSLEREGKRMHHCVGASLDSILNLKFYSFRDCRNKPLITILVNVKSKSVVEIKGYANSCISGKLSIYVVDFFNNGISKIVEGGMKYEAYPGIFMQNGMWYSIYE